jgi:hypothetical protein
MRFPHLDNLPTPEEVAALRRAQGFGKGTPPVLARHEKRKAKRTAEETFRQAVWARDGGVSRCSGKPLLHASLDPDRRGEVAHLKARSTNPREKVNPANGVLLSATEHALSDARTAGGKVLLEIKGTDARKLLRFIRRDQSGKVLWSRASRPPVKARPR